MRPRPHQRLTLLALLLAAAAGPATRPTTAPAPPAFDTDAIGSKVMLLGHTRQPLGQVMTLTGVVVAGPFKGYDGGPNLIVQRIDGVATQEYIRIPIAGGTFDPPKDGHDLRPRFTAGSTYALHGYETGQFIGLPAGGNDGGVTPQTCGFCFRREFALNWGAEPKAVPAVTFTPADFVNRPALLAGTAANADGVGWLVGPGWRLRSADDGSPWPDWMAGKPAEVDGVVRPGHGTDYQSEHAARRLVRLADQVGHPVDLHGLACNLNQDWWFIYRGDRVDIDRMDQLPGWSWRMHLHPTVLHGTLARDGDRYVVRGPSWSDLPSLRSVELPADWVGVIDPYAGM